MNAAPVGGASSSASLATLLVVEDDVMIRYVVCDALRHAGYKVLEASSAREALAVLRTLPVDLVFVDVHMPGDGDGVSVARFVRDHQPRTGIILTSGKVRASEIPDVDALGPFIAKPYLISRVLRLVSENLDPAGDRER